MKLPKASLIVLALLFSIVFQNVVRACSMYKITVEGKTITGCNHDTWFTTPKIWFENAKSANGYDACFTGAREVTDGRTAPQSGMNETGLTFSRLVAYYPEQKNPFTDRKQINDEINYLSKILHQCATVADVRKFIEQYDHSIFIDDVYIYIDSTGNYLIVEPYKLINGNDSNYVLANFCPSITDNESARKLERYRNGEDYLRNHNVNSSIAFSSALSDTMHVCRNRNGDGTLLSSIWNSKDGTVDLYFYHSYDTGVQFNLKEEFAKGNHSLNIPDLFPKNAEFERLKNYKTPFNTPILRVLLVVIAALFCLLTLFYFVFLLKNKNHDTSSISITLTSGLNLLLIVYLFILATNVNIYYFDAPYKHYSSSLKSAFSYMPFLLLISIIPFTLFTVKKLQSNKTGLGLKITTTVNNILYFMLIVVFIYWGLYSVWN